MLEGCIGVLAIIGFVTVVAVTAKALAWLNDK
jgi:hypothetical protein